MVSTSRVVYATTRCYWPALTATVFLGALAGCEQPPPEDEIPIRPVRYARVVAQGVSESRTYSGTTQAELETDLSFRVGGTLVRRPVSVGSSVNRGDLVAALDGTDFQVRLDEARAGLARAEAERRNAQASYERTRNLYEIQNASRTQLDSSRAVAESAEAQFRAASQQVEAARLQLSYAELTAPQQCTVAQTFVEINQNVSAGQAIARLNCGQCAEVVVSVPDTDIARIEPGMAVKASVSALSDEYLEGTVKEVGIATGARGATYPVTVSLRQRCDSLRSGMAVDVTFDFPTAIDTGNLVVPYVAVGEDREGRYVYVLEPDAEGRIFANRRSVQTAAATATGIVITQGLTEGELIATAGVRRLKPGQEVTLLGGQSEMNP